MGIQTPNRTTSNLTIAVYRTPEPQAEDDRDDKGDRTEPGEEADRPQTLYLILDPGQVPSSASEVVMLVGTMEELRGRTGGGDEDEKGL